MDCHGQEPVSSKHFFGKKMPPFINSFPHHPNQTRNEESNCSAPQQVVVSNPCLTNSSNVGGNLNHQLPCSSCGCHNSSASRNSVQFHSQSHEYNPQFPIPFDNSSTQFANLGRDAMATHGRPPMTPFPCFPNVRNQPFPLPNSHVGMSLLGLAAPQHFMQPHGQFCSQNTPLNMNPTMSSPLRGLFYNLPQNSNQIAPSRSHGQLFVHNHPQAINQTMPLQHNLCVNGPNGQFYSPNVPQHLNQITYSPRGQFLLPNPMQNVNKPVAMQCSENPVDPTQPVPYNVTSCFHPSLGCSNQAAQTVHSQNPAFHMNSQLDMGNSNQVAQKNNQDNHMFNSPTTGRNSLQVPPITSQQLQGGFLPSHGGGSVQMQQGQKNLHPSGLHQTKTNWRNPQSQNSTRNHESGKREPFRSRFQKSQFHSMPNAKGNSKSFNWKGEKGNSNKGARNSHLGNSTKQARVEHHRSLPLNYTEQEIQQWREARRKNYPSKFNIEKKLSKKETDPGAIDRDAKTRRQQLKEILAKQAALGVEVAEIPPDYLSESENQVCERKEEKRVWTKKGRFQNKYPKRGRHGQENRFAKKQRLADKDSSTMPALNRRKPTLLQKLLSADMKRDKSHLLQVFRFMVINSFFKDWPEKQLDFPLITVKDVELKSKVVEEKSTPHEGNDGASGVSENAMVVEFGGPKYHNMADEDGYGNDGENVNEDDDAEVEEMVYRFDGETNCVREEIERSEGEEGEIID